MSNENSSDTPRMSPDVYAAIEAIIYAAEEPATLAQIAAALGQEKAAVEQAVRVLMERCAGDERGIEIRAVAGGFRMATKPQTHEAVRAFIKNLKPPLRLSLPALETLAVIAYRQPVTAPEIKEIRGVDAAGVLNTLLEKRLITTTGRKEVVGRPILYKTTREFLIRFGLNTVDELPTLKEFEELTRAGIEGIDLEPEAADAGESAALPGAADAAVEPGSDAEPIPEPQATAADSGESDASSSETTSEPGQTAHEAEASDDFDDLPAAAGQ